MIKIRIDEILKIEDRNIRWLAIKADINYSTLYNFLTSKTESVNFNVIEKLCSALDCPIQDVIEYRSDINGRVPDSKYDFDLFPDRNIMEVAGKVEGFNIESQQKTSEQ